MLKKNKLPFLCTLLSTLPRFVLFCEEIILFINNSLQCGGCLFFYCLPSHYSLGNSFIPFRFPGGFILSETQQKETLQAISLRACEFMLTVCGTRRPKQSPNLALEGSVCTVVMTKISEIILTSLLLDVFTSVGVLTVFVWTQSFCFSLFLH